MYFTRSQKKIHLLHYIYLTANVTNSHFAHKQQSSNDVMLCSTEALIGLLSMSENWQLFGFENTI